MQKVDLIQEENQNKQAAYESEDESNDSDGDTYLTSNDSEGDRDCRHGGRSFIFSKMDGDNVMTSAAVDKYVIAENSFSNKDDSNSTESVNLANVDGLALQILGDTSYYEQNACILQIISIQRFLRGYLERRRWPFRRKTLTCKRNLARLRAARHAHQAIKTSWIGI